MRIRPTGPIFTPASDAASAFSGGPVFGKEIMREFFGKKNYLGVGAAVLMLAVGFILLGLKPANNPLALKVAPFILVGAYLVVIPISLWKGRKEERDSREGV